MDSNQNKSYEDDDINTYYNQGNEDDVLNLLAII